MKKYLVILLSAVLVSSAASAQSLKFGPKLGANLGKIDGKNFSDQYALGYHVGGFVEIGLGKKWGIQPEVLWNQIKADTVSGFNNVYQVDATKFENPQLNYLSIPLLLNYKPVKVLTLQAGPQFGILLDKSKNLLDNGKEAFKTGDMSLLVGAQLNILKIRVYGRYAVGLSDISDASTPEKWKSQTIQVGVGIAL
ncbi:MAG: porin family protein [Chitinophagaceae bacterium]